MIKFIIARHNEEVYKSYLGESLKNLDTHSYDVYGEESIFKKYNDGINACIEDGLKDDDIICFCHEDVKILDNNFEKKLQFVFDNRKDIGIVGVIGCREYSEGGAWWINDSSKLCGHIIQENEDNIYHLVKGSVGFFDDAVIVDGLFIAVKGSLLKNGLKFNEELNSFHLYDVQICLDVLLMGYKVCVCDILMQHKSPGMGFLTKEWTESKDKLINIYKERGINFPLISKNNE